jgi:tellurium resistance protein TerD
MTEKNQDNINITEQDQTIKIMRVAAGWDIKSFDGEDLSCFLLGSDGQTREDTDFVFYNSLMSADMSVRHAGDNRDGLGEGDDEAIIVDTNSLSYEIYKIVFVVSIYMADEKDQTFSQIDNAFVRVVNEDNDAEVLREDMTDNFVDATAVEFCELERVGAEWYFQNTYTPATGGLKEIAEKYGCMISGIG